MMIPDVADRAAELEQLCRAYHVRRLDLFGSAAAGRFQSALKGTLLNYWNNLERRILNSGNSTTSPTYQSRNGTVPHGLRHAAEVQYAQGW